MAYTSGTADDYQDLLADVYTFATANGWTGLESSTEAIYLKGTGLAAADEIYCGISTYEVPASGLYNWQLHGSFGYVSGRAYTSMPMANPFNVYSCYWNSSIPYWIVANGRRIIVVAKVSTSYFTIYLGLLDTSIVAIDKQYPYPLFIGGCGNVSTYNYSSASTRSFWANTPANSPLSGCLVKPGGRWGVLNSSGGVETGYLLEDMSYVHTTPGGGYYLDPLFLKLDYTQAQQNFGLLEGIYRVTGYNNTAENIITIDSVDYLVVPDIARSTASDYCAVRLS